ncbi:hypothetical protein E8L99_11095 [Phreatobacter aquaticus]|uniref:Peptidase C13 n=1 Tax=Phreatobacter aquaticus TaxID=2570229 RepID=A0A4D7QKN2_9HYPH|nr:C13 family peptidase [Phreatobacter aquaticus]QCK86259.1 hypothetical protein E8L99_11095 [Phreatobacter aquaticus]
MGIGQTIAAGYRLVTAKTLLPPARRSPFRLVAVTCTMIACLLLIDWATSGADGTWDMYGLNALIAWVAVLVAITLAFAGRDPTARVTWHLLIVLLAQTVAATLVVLLALPLLGLPGWPAIAGLIASAAAALGLLTLAFVATRRIFLHGAGSRRPTLRALGLSVASLAAALAFPYSPAFVGSDFDRSTANVWEFASRLSQPQQTEAMAEQRRDYMRRQAQAKLAQPALMTAALDGLAPVDPSAPNVFVLGIAGWARQNVFLNEAEQAVAALAVRLRATGRTMTLINNPGTSASRPIASIQNLAQALQGIARRMDTERDVLVLAMTSHGNRDGFALEFGALVYETLSPESLKTALDEAGIRNRILIVSSCYSGTFVPVLADENTMIMTASSAERNSFGCSDTRSLTYFGEALLENGLRQSDSLIGAFTVARRLVGEWEAEQKLTPSQPQIHVGSRLRTRLGAVIGTDDEWVRLVASNRIGANVSQ